MSRTLGDTRHRGPLARSDEPIGVDVARLQVRQLLAVAAVVLVLIGKLAKLTHGRVVVSGWRIFECQRVGGSWPVELASEAKLRAGYEVTNLESVRDGGVTFVGGEIARISDGRAVGVGVWVLGAKQQVAAVYRIARRWSGRDSSLSGHGGAIGGTRRCAQQ